MFFLNNLTIKTIMSNFFLDPSEQFDIIIFKIPYFVELNNLTIFVFIVFILLYIISLDNNQLNINNSEKTLEYQNITIFNFFFLELSNFVDNIVDANTNLSKQFLYVFFFIYFIFILSVNFMGLIPYSYTITSSFIVTLYLSLSLFTLINLIGIYRMGLLPFFSMFVPTGTPLQIIFLLVVIELVSYFARLFSLAIRLFANMMAGHTLLKILIGFAYLMLISISGLIPFSIIPWLLVTIIFVLEILISFLQAYVFVISVCIHSNDVVISH